MTIRSICWIFLVCSLGGCVSAKKYDAALKSSADAQAALEADQRELKELNAARQRDLDNATAENAELRRELARLGTDVDALLSEKGTLASALSESRARLVELRRAEAAAAARAQLYRDLALRLKQMVDAGSLSITLREGRMVLQLPNDILFDTGRTQIKREGRVALQEIAAVLKTLEGRKFHIGGHTDNVPISNERFPSNWELSLGRGLEVLRLLVAEGVAPTMVAAEGYGEFDPVASNDDLAGRAKNRRTEIALQPNVEELVAVPEAHSLSTI